MKIIIRILFFTFAMLAFNAFAAPNDVSQYLNYPNTTLVATSKEDDTRTTAPIAKNADTPKRKNAAPRFYSPIPIPLTDHVALSWEMFKKTDYGDLYLIVIHRDGQKDVAYPVLFTGMTQTVVDAPDVNIEMFPNPPAKK